MTAQEYQAAGYRISQHTEQATIDQAEESVKRFYIAPIVGQYDEHDADQVAALMCLVVIALSQANVFATRVGGREKTATQSTIASMELVLQEHGYRAHSLLEVLRQKDGADKSAKVEDFLKIYFNTNFVNL